MYLLEQLVGKKYQLAGISSEMYFPEHLHFMPVKPHVCTTSHLAAGRLDECLQTVLEHFEVSDCLIWNLWVCTGIQTGNFVVDQTWGLSPFSVCEPFCWFISQRNFASYSLQCLIFFNCGIQTANYFSSAYLCFQCFLG